MADQQRAKNGYSMTQAMLTISEAAAAAGVDRRTVRRKLDAGLLPGAIRSDGPAGAGTGPWSIPAVELIAAGIDLGGAQRAAVVTPANDSPAITAVDLEALKRRLAVAEAIAEERRLALDDARLALRALASGNVSPAPPDEATPPSRRGVKRRPWWPLRK